MLRLFKAFLFRLRRDLTFRITLFIGIGMAVLMTLLYLGLQLLLSTDGMQVKMLTGSSMLISSLSPAQNFGIAVPINLISFTIVEFTHGTIRNKVIAGNSKGKIYASLFLSGLIFSIALMTVYASLCTLLGTIFGGFDPDDGVGVTASMSMGSHYSGQFIFRMILVAVVCYVSISSFAVFIATLIRQIGGAIPIVLIGVLAVYLLGTIVSAMAAFDNSLDVLVRIVRWADPLYALSEQETIMDEATGKAMTYMRDDTFIAALVNNAAYACAFFAAGFFIFRKRDIK